MQISVLFARFPFGFSENPRCTDWLVKTVLEAKEDKRISDIQHIAIDDTPITMSRNRCLKRAQQSGADIVLMVDSDMAPDLDIPGAKPFFSTTLDFMLAHEGPCVVGAPYCGGPPVENVFIFRWAKRADDHPNVDLHIAQYSREEAAARAGFEEVAALPTGLIMIDMRCLQYIDPPWFEYEYEDAPFNTSKSTTEDVYFTRNLSLAGVPQYVNWDAWAGHVKRKTVGKPTRLTEDDVRAQFRRSILEGRKRGERLIDVCPANGFPSVEGAQAFRDSLAKSRNVVELD